MQLHQIYVTWLHLHFGYLMIFATWYSWCTLIDFTFCDFHPTHSEPCCEVPDGQGPCSSSEKQAKGQKLKKHLPKSGFEVKVYLWPYNINHCNNTNTSNNGDIWIDRTLALYEKAILKHLFHSLCRASELWTFAIRYNLQQDEMMLLHVRQFLTENIFQTEIQTEATNWSPNWKNCNCFLWADCT